MKIIANKKQSLLSLLKESFPDSSNRSIKTWILKARIKVNNSFIKKPHKIIEKDTIIYLMPEKKHLYKDLEIISESDNYFVLSKPANLLTVPLDNKSEISVFGILKKNYPKLNIYPIHRLDREVSGLVLFAKNKQTQLAFKTLFEKRQINKYYIALVENFFTEKNGCFNIPLIELKSLHVVYDPKGKDAITYYKVIDEKLNYSTVLVTTKTGRKHQIRVHFSNANHPILGDVRYHSKKQFHKRIALHALYLSFKDPITFKNKTFFSEIPKEFSVKNQKNIYAVINEENKKSH
jgi:23S rRNA pseudouridine1911/1915/1917 synthase